MKMIRLIGSGVLPMIMLLACRPKYTPTPAYTALNDFENIVGWVNDPTNNNYTVEKGNAYSGHYYSHINANMHFSYIFRSKFRDLTEKKIYWIRVSAKCKKGDTDVKRATVACNIQDTLGTTVHWQELPLRSDFYGKNDEWITVVKTFEISSKYKPSHYVGVFFWNGDKNDDMKIDDFKVEFFH
jgi:hypothetical protein